ncbi:hypothetical protein J2T57_002478 [Natronocella acetinitrilica]|jgi:hypothetical protein|uniref:DUF4168 domain-containing protein n=1 Tax=Natronocella acetinitrilica TaxID=414046 RepID=A0AAE3G3W6_9GAMM|nr:DUF4168 domain-containing protein [Natronocella acetinitrilica]MCP1675330.1 hypothetical protein [Natronocella acetinitrilica]
MQSSIRYLATLIALAALALAPSFATADDGPDLYENEVADSTELSADDIDDDQLAGLYIAANNIQEVRAEYAALIQEADESQRMDLRQQANEEMRRVLVDADLDPDLYREIAYLLQQDEDLMQRLNAVVASMR